MKKWGTLLLISVMVIVLSACNSTAEQKSDSNESKKSELTLEQVYEKAIERQKELKSVKSVMKMDSKISYKSESESYEMNSKTDMTIDMVNNPLSMYMGGTMTMPNPESGEDLNVNMEMYMNEDGFYMQDSQSKQWMKLPSEQFEAIMGQTANQANASQQLEELKSFINDFKFEQTDNQYILTLNAAGEKFSEYILKQMKINETLSLPEEGQQALKNMKFNKVNYVITVDKESFDVVAVDTNIDMTFDVESEVINMLMNAKITFKEFNSIENITVPQEVIDQAVEVQY